MFIRCRRNCASTERCKKHHPRYSKHRPRYSKHRPRYSKHRPRYSKHRPRYSKHRPKYSDNGRDRAFLGTPSSGGRFRLNRSGLVKQLPRAHSTDASKELDPELPETVEDSLIRHPGVVPVSLHFTANTDGGQSSDSSLRCLQDSPKYQNLSKRR